jgi:hypothetical protein
MNAPRRRIGAPLLGVLALTLLCSSGAPAPGATVGEPLRERLVGYLEGGMQAAATSPGEPLSPLRSYPLLATTSFLLLEDDPSTLAASYAAISRAVLAPFEDANVSASGLIRGMGGAGPGISSLSPGLNALASIDLYSLHLIAWKTGRYEDALEYLSWAASLSDAVTKSFYDPSRRCFYPLDAGEEFITTYGPGQLLPLVMDRMLGASMRERAEDAYRLRSVSQPSSRQGSPAVEPWDDPLMRFTILDLLAAAIPADGDLYQSLRSAAEAGASPTGTAQAAWTDYWRGNRFVRDRLFPPWKPISPLVNVTLLLEREGVADPRELAALRGGIDSITTALSAETLSLDAYVGAIGAVNRLLVRTSRLDTLLDSTKERWRVLDDAKWTRLSPRIKRLVKEALDGAPRDLLAAKVDLAARLERGSGVAFRLALPERPVPAGSSIDFTASLRVRRDTLAASRIYVQVGEMRWKATEPSATVTLAAGGAPFIYEGSLTLDPALGPGIVMLPSSIDFAGGGRRIEIHRFESVALANEYDVTLDLPDGRRIGATPLPIRLTLRYHPDREVQGTVDGTFLRELTTDPELPSRFVVRRGADRTDLTLTVSPKGPISPGRYPFSLTMTLDGKPIALFEETLVRPFRWLHLGVLPRSDDVMKNALAFQSDLLKAYAGPEGRPLHWREAPADAVDGEGSLWPQHLYGATADGSALLYTAIDAPTRMRLSWTLATNNEAAMWINGEPTVAAASGPLREASGTVELRKGPNSFLIALHWGEAPDRVSFELEDENGLPPAGLDNELDTIVEGYERLGAPDTVARPAAPPAEQLKGVTVRYAGADATEVSIIGSFNNWEPGATPMRREAPGKWIVVLHLRPGRYPYKLLVNRRQKLVDPANPATEPDGFGGTNSILQVR